MVRIDREDFRLRARFRGAMRRAGVAAGDRLLIAVSGGADSAALLDLVHGDAATRGWSIDVGHVDHGLRPESADDLAWVEALARSRGIEFHGARLRGSPAQGESVEAWARRGRRAALKRMAARTGARWILLAHHQDDQAETLLLQLLRGAGLEGLCAMAPARPPFLRPLLDSRREELRGYLRRRDLDWREDPSNSSPRFARNRIRASVLPLLEREFGPAVTRLLARTSDALRPIRAAERLRIATALAEARVESPSDPREAGIRLDRPKLRSYDRATLEGCVRAAFRSVQGSTRNLKRAHVIALAELTRLGPPRILHLPEGVIARVDRVHLLLEPAPRSPSREFRPSVNELGGVDACT